LAIIYGEEWAIKAQERLDEPTKVKDIFKMTYTNERVLHNPYRTDASVAALTPYSAYTPAAVALTDDYVTIDAHRVVSQIIDRADLAQSTYLNQMDLADAQGVLLNEDLESLAFAQYAQFTSFDNTEIGGAAGNIIVSSSNIDDIIRAIDQKIAVAKGDKLKERNGGFIVWRPADFNLLTAFMQANGFSTADSALSNGVKGGVEYMGFTHYRSNSLTAGHLLAGVKQLAEIGIVKDTYGQVMINEKDPGNVSGISVVMRLDYKVKVWTKTLPVLYNVTVA
jgi:hypothetical protein